MSGTRVRPMPQVPCILHTIHVYCILLCVYTSMLHTRQVQVSAYFKVSMRHPAFCLYMMATGVSVSGIICRFGHLSGTQNGFSQKRLDHANL